MGTAWFDWAWYAWFGLFAIIEGMALFNSKGGDTLSEHVWAWFGVKNVLTPASTTATRQPTGWTRARRFVLLALLAWLFVHFAFGGQWA